MLKRWAFLLVFSLAGVAASAVPPGELVEASPEDVGIDSTRLARVSDFAQGYIDRGELAGAVVMVARRGKTVLFEKYGERDLESGSPMELDTIFRIYSMTKPVTTVAAMTLYEKGRFRLTDPVSKYLPEFADIKVLVGSEEGNVREVPPDHPITIQDLMTHTAGFTYGVFGDTEVDRRYRELELLRSERDLKGMMQELSKIPLQYQPGTRWHYGVSTDVLGYLIEVVSGMSLDQFLEQNVFQPLDMKDTGFWVPEEKIARFSTCYGPLNDEEKAAAAEGERLKVVDHPRASRWASRPRHLSGGGGLVSTARDYMRFCQMLLNDGELDGTRILGRKTVEFMTRNHLPREILDRNPLGGFGFGLGFAVLMDVPRSGSVGSVGEFNWGGYASTLFWVDPREELIAILMTQYLPSGVYPLREEFKAALYPSLVN